MNDFVNPQHRGVNLPLGFKDLMDVLEAKNALGAETPIYALHSNRSVPVFEWHAQGLSQVERFLNRVLNSNSEDSCLSIHNDDYVFALRRCGEVFRAFVTFRARELILQRALREIFAEAGFIPVSPEIGPCVYSFEVPIRGTQILGVVTKVLRAYGISDTEELKFFLRA